ncbi:helix-turn-helix domain-containing protein [Xanthocytophaga agilis]|uniref:Helix-turn-helix domain-containing protein n=1 Tax=Xanthocytophaga agilis TaxID=3048010 RepID=A0AAE3RCG8_9BACT|nr:helix-turn-helix domain-containing protein [Xanthocytophaga agilis]MDJ1505824.1 helix-turn-helix domain-containing protein [Xanthocytophaga agilis]
MEYLQYRIPVSTEFSEVFSHFYFAENRSEHSITKTLLPSYQTILIFSFGASAFLYTEEEQIQVNKCIVLGPIKKAFTYSLLPSTQLLVANFKDDAFYRFFGSSTIAENLPLDPDSLLEENCFTILRDGMAQFKDPVDQVNYILSFCKPYLKERNVVVEKLVHLKHSAYNPIKKVADNENLSERSIQLNHKKYLGYSAKELTRYQRFLKAIEMIQSIATKATKNDWFEIIDKCGYYDQSQLINDFNYYINLSPAKYLKLQCDICNPIS